MPVFDPFEAEKQERAERANEEGSGDTIKTGRMDLKTTVTCCHKCGDPAVTLEEEQPVCRAHAESEKAPVIGNWADSV